MMSNKPTMSHNVCYAKLTRFAGKDIYGWNVSEGMLVYDSDRQLYGIVERVCVECLRFAAAVYVRFRSRKGEFFSSYYTSKAASSVLFAVDKDCYVICRNGYLFYGSHCYNSTLADAVDSVVTKIDSKHKQVFIRPVDAPRFGFWVPVSDVVCNHLIKE